jgi:hypothetical protein
MSWTKSYEHAKWWWRDEEGCEADGRHNRVIYRAQVPPQAILAYMVYPEVEYSDGYGDQFVVDPEFLSDSNVGIFAVYPKVGHRSTPVYGDGCMGWLPKSQGALAARITAENQARDFFRGFSHKGPDLNGDGRKSAPGW